MSRDLQFISVVDDLQVTRIEDLVGADPRTLRVTGRGGFNSAQRVIINDFGIDAFTLVSDTILLVAPGPVFDAVPVTRMNVAVVAGAATGTQRVRLLFGPTKNTRTVQGVQKLIQQVVKSLLSNSGSNRFNSSEGGDLVRALGESLSPSGLSRITAVLARAASITEQQFVSSQASVRGLPADERLLSLSLGDVTFDRDRLEVRAALRLVTYAGRSLSIPLTL